MLDGDGLSARPFAALNGKRRRDVDRLKAYVAHLEKQQSGQTVTPTLPIDDSSALQEVSDVQLKLTRTCQALLAVLRHFDKMVSVDMERKVMLDMSRLRNNVLVDATLATPFVEWLHLNRDIPGGAET